MKGTPYLNPDPFCRFIGPRNWGEALIDDKLTTCLLDNGSQLNFVTPTYAHETGMDILSLDTLAQEIDGQLPPIAVMGGGMIKPEGFVIMNVRVPCVRGYNEDQIAIVLEDPEMKDCPVILGTPTLFRVMEEIKESEISELAMPWANLRLSWLMRGVHAKMSRLHKPLPKEEVQDYLDKIPYPGVKAVLDNAITPLEERAELGVRPNPEGVKANQEEAVVARAAKLASTNIIDWKVEQKEDPVLYQVVKHLRAPRETFKEALLTVLDKRKLQLPMLRPRSNCSSRTASCIARPISGLPRRPSFQFVGPQRHRSVAMDGCHREAAHQGQRRSASLMQERFWWPGMARDLRNRIRKCGRCRKFEAAPPIVPMQPLTCSGPGELLHVDFTSIEETVPLKEEPVIRYVLVLQDHFSKYVVAYVVKVQTARTAAVTLRNGYFGLFGAPAYLVSDQGKAFTGHLITHLCELYGVHKLRTSPYHAQTNGQVERMNQSHYTDDW